MLLSLLIAERYPAIAHIPEPLAFFRRHADSITSEKKDAVMSAYTRARIWFAARHHDEQFLDIAFGAAWLQALNKRRRWIGPHGLASELLLPEERRPHALRSLLAALRERFA